MPEIKKPNFPQTPDGVTDWEKVFEDQENGLVPLVARAPTNDVLRACVMAIIMQLFTRRDDKLEIKRLEIQLEGIFATAGSSLPTNDVIALLREVKDQRILRAQVYLAEKNTKPLDRRSDTFWQRAEKTLYLIVNNPRNFAITVSTMLALTALIFIALYFGLEQRSAKKPSHPAAVETVQRSAKESSTPATEPKPNAPPAIEKQKKPKTDDGQPPEPPKLVILEYVHLPRTSNLKAADGLALILPIIILNDRNDLSALCRIRPNILDMFNARFSRAFGNDKTPSPRELERISALVTSEINQKLRRDVVKAIQLTKVKSLKYSPPMNCTIAPEKFQELLD